MTNTRPGPEIADMKTVRPVAVEQEKVVTKVVSGKVTKRKKTIGQSFGDIFLSEDASGVGKYILFDVLIPGARDMIFDMLQQGLKMALYGENKAPKNVSRGTNGSSYVSYSSYYDKDDRRGRQSSSNRGQYNRKASNDFRDIIFDRKLEAEEVLSCLADVIEQYDIVSVADFNELSGLESNYCDNGYGWDNLRDTRVLKCRDGYYIDLPRPIPIRS